MCRVHMGGKGTLLAWPSSATQAHVPMRREGRRRERGLTSCMAFSGVSSRLMLDAHVNITAAVPRTMPLFSADASTCG